VKIRYMYDLEGIAGARYYNGSEVTEYEYVKDGYNNVIAIVKGDTIVAKYVYDAWGNIIREERPNFNEPFAKINPIRYRSYYYDIETKLYYLQTRYYNPEIGAFISPDSTDYLDAKKISGLNLYTYCYNNPVMYYDPTGHSAIIVGLIIGAIVGAAIGGAVAYSYASQNGKEGWELFGFTILGIFGGALLGATIGAGLGYIWGATLPLSIPTFGLVNSGGLLGFGITGSMAVAVPMGEIVVVGSVAALAYGLTVMAANVGKSGGYRVKHYYPNDHQPPHVHIYGDDIKGSHGIRVGLDGKPLKGEPSLSPQAKNAITKLLEVIKEVLGPWIG
ncbi:MAG: hypothetical protein K2H02_05660, partial [Anaeroplasmataceae bacterium]|nr:hypothetical protein [Anaeroplasmataceae bacterium]